MTQYIPYQNMLCALYSDIASAFPAHKKSTHEMDLRCLHRRFASEGIAFLTKTLPRYGKAVDMALSTGSVLDVPSFEKKKGSKLPKFLGWLLEQVFDDDGAELDDSNPVALKYLRQLLYLFYKLEMPYSELDISRVLGEFKSTDAALGQGWYISEPLHKLELEYASKLIRRVLAGACPRNIVPKHGPGSVATGESSSEKPYFRRDYREATSYYPIDSHYYFNSAHLSDCLDGTELKTRDCQGRLRPWETMDQSTAKVVLVPKDSRGPRLISMEPLEIQWLQQGQCEVLVSTLESHWLTCGHINFQLQDINRFLAWRSSYDAVACPKPWEEPEGANFILRGLRIYRQTQPQSKIWRHSDVPDTLMDEIPKLVTADMKEASDRVSMAHICNLFPSNWVEALYATRSSRTELPSGEIVNLNKFAPMGSAVCFPVEALIFWALAIASIRYNSPHFASQNDGRMLLLDLKKRVWVYGDDLILHGEDYAMVKQSLERTGLLLNANKCCTARFFRESCGMDAYKGTNVTPLRIKECVGLVWTGQMLMSYVSYSNEAYRRGYIELANVLEKIISDQVKVPFTTVDRGLVQFVRPDANVSALNRRARIRVRYNNELHFLEAYGPTPRAISTGNHPITWESYLNRSITQVRTATTEVPPNICEPGRKLLGARDMLKADQYPIPRRVTSNRGWKQVTL